MECHSLERFLHSQMDEYGKRKEDCGDGAKTENSSSHPQDTKKGAQGADILSNVANKMLWKIKDRQDQNKQETVQIEERNEPSPRQEQKQDNVDERSHISLLCKEEGRWSYQQGIEEHLGSKHGEFFKGRKSPTPGKLLCSPPTSQVLAMSAKESTVMNPETSASQEYYKGVTGQNVMRAGA